jgi:hypothetical protein
VLLAGACSDGGDSSPQSAASPVAGQAQKGPFAAGSVVMFYELDAHGSRTGRATSTATDALGRFPLAATWRGPTEVEVSGDFFDEYNALPSAAPRRLKAIVDLPATGRIAVNLFTHLAGARMQTRMSAGDSFEAALTTAVNELRTLFDLVADDNATLARLDITAGAAPDAADNANLLLLSAATQKAGSTQGELDALGDDFADDGLLNGAALPVWLRLAVHAGTIDLDRVGRNLETLPGVATAPGFAALGNSYPAWVNVNADSDGDGLADAAEILVHGTDVLSSDSDADGLSDGDEILTHASDPLHTDSDGDGLPDGWEITNLFDPLGNDSGGDADGDGLDNLGEYLNATDPHLGDSDGDGYGDASELANGGDPNDAASLPLAFVSAPATAAETGFAWSYAAAVTWPGAGYVLDSAPAGMSVDAGSGLLAWTPTFAQTGSFTVTLRATSGAWSVTQSFVIVASAGNTGDINEDSLVDARDILLGERIALGLLLPSAAQQVRADLSGDGNIDGTDVIGIQRLALGL